MAESSSRGNDAGIDSNAGLDPSATFQKIQDLLKARDDTSRFVGLALLKTVLDNGPLLQDSERLRVLWESLSPKFLDRLLRAQQNEKVNELEARNMVDLAVAILHTFTILLPEDSKNEKRLTGRTAPLVKALLNSPAETRKLILQTLLTISSQSEGALELLSVPDIAPLIQIATQDPLVLEIIGYAWMTASTIGTEVQTVRESIEKFMPALVTTFKDTDAVTLISFVGNLLPKLELETIPRSPTWLAPLIVMLRKLVTSKPTATGRAAYTQLASALLQAYPATCPALLFKDDPSNDSNSKPFSYLFVNLLLIDLRSSFPSLLSQLNDSQYPATSQRLATAFDVISSFIGFLVRSLDEEINSTGFTMAPDLLLKLRKDVAETMSLTIEYLRDRWDASIAGVSGLHPSARSGAAATSEGTRLTLTWESMKDTINTDPLVLAATRALAIWIREDENENLRNESAGLMDMLVELYKASSTGSLDFRYPILLALEGIMITEDGVEGFLGQDGWHVVFQDLQSIVKSVSDHPTFENSAILGEAGRGIQIVRVLLAIVDHDSTSFPREDWMTAVTTTAAIKVPADAPLPMLIELDIAMLQLSMALLSKSATGMSRRYKTSHAALFGLVKQLRTLVGKMDDEADAGDFRGLLDDIELDLGNFRVE